jgi:hypothetical protein
MASMTINIIQIVLTYYYMFQILFLHIMDRKFDYPTTCIICNDTGGVLYPTHTNSTNDDTVQKILTYSQKRYTYGEVNYGATYDRLSDLPESTYSQIKYHRTCYQDLTHKDKLIRAEKRYNLHSKIASPEAVRKRKGRPKIVTENSDPSRSKRKKILPLQKTCTFACDHPESGELHKVETVNRGKLLMDIKTETKSDKIRAVLSGVQVAGDCSAKELWYHRDCLRTAQRDCCITHDKETVNTEFINAVNTRMAQAEILNFVQETINSGQVLYLEDVEDEYSNILNEYDLPSKTRESNKIFLKQLITEHISDAQFVTHSCRRKGSQIIGSKYLGDAVSQYHEQNVEEAVKNILSVAKILRMELLNERDKWKFKGKLDDFNRPKMTSFFLRNLFAGTISRTLPKEKEHEMNRNITISAQILLKNIKTDRQISYNSKSSTFHDKSETPISIGLGLYLRVHYRNFVVSDTMSKLCIISPYKDILNIEERIRTDVITHMDLTGGFVLPEWVKKGVPIHLAIDNIDWREDKEDQFHGTILVLIQHDTPNGIPIQGPLTIPDKAKSIQYEVNYRDSPNIVLSKVQYEEKYAEPPSYTHTIESYTNHDQTFMLSAYTNYRYYINHKKECLVNKYDCKFCSAKPIPSWAATNALLIDASDKHPKKTLSGIVSPLYRKSPTDYGTLYTRIIGCRGVMC